MAEILLLAGERILMILFVDETENDDYFIVTGLLVESQNDVNLIYNRFKRKAKNINISDKKKSQLFTEFKSTLLDRKYQKLKISMLSELSSIDHYIIYSCYVKKDSYFPQVLKEEVYIQLLSKIVENASCDLNIVFDAFNKKDFESNIIASILALPSVITIESCDSQKNPGLQFVDNLCSTCRHHLDNDDPYNFYDIIKDNVKEI